MHPADRFSLRVAPSEEGERLDVFLAARLPGLTRSRAARLLEQRLVQVNGAARKAAHRLKAGEMVSGTLPAPEPSEDLPEPIALHVLHEDDQLVVIDKPPGMVVHPAPGHHGGTLVNALLYHCRELPGIGGCRRPGIVHRLDKDTSGVLVAAKTEAAHEELSRQFKQRQVEKIYQALAWGGMEADSGRILLPIGRHPQDRKRMATVSRKPRQAETRWRVCERFSGHCLLEVALKTGRTHQIRVHLAAVHHPLVGDPVYGLRPRAAAAAARSLPPAAQRALARVRRQMLHAWRLGFVHPATGQRVVFEAPLPSDMLAVLAALRGEDFGA